MTDEAQITDAVIMVRPASFTSNPETAASNNFQADLGDADPELIREQARREFDALSGALQDAGVSVLVFEDSPEPETPDALFPNNWLSTHSDGVAVLYPMEAPSRRAERRTDILESLKEEQGCQLLQQEDISRHEDKGRYLEGTGSLILDRPNRIAYACLSSRTHPALFHDWCEKFGYSPEGFTAKNQGQEIYHTNVMMCLGERFALICAAAIEDEQERLRVMSRLQKTGHELLLISIEQMNRFAGNMLQLSSADGERLIAMSQQAYDALDGDQRKILENHGRLLPVDISTIETYAGGSVRCMLAENFLPRAIAQGS